MRQILEQLQAIHGEVEMGLSVVTVVELVHGIQRAKMNRAVCVAKRLLMN
ncbi:MAG: hypothetical protein JO185_14705 [Acidobacteriaceae bacterium]|nr:hypothetical protein [Acidobacteriaceae bacterium]